MRCAYFFAAAVAALAVSGPACAAQDGSQPAGWKAVLIAGDDSEPAFDNAVDAMADKLEGFGVEQKDIAVLKASGDGAPVATKANITEAFTALDPGSGEGCFVYITSHGMYGRGLVLTPQHLVFTPRSLANFLNGSCGGRPSVVIASGCYSGLYADGPPLPAPNRTILTAARPDRPSFGCNAHLQYTIFDKCMLDSLKRGLAWTAVMDETRACVSGNEFDLRIRAPSEPQIFVGADEAKLLVFSR